MSGSENGQLSTSLSTAHMTKKTKVVLAVFGSLCVFAVVAIVCAALFSNPSSDGRPNSSVDDLAARETVSIESSALESSKQQTYNSQVDKPREKAMKRRAIRSRVRAARSSHEEEGGQDDGSPDTGGQDEQPNRGGGRGTVRNPNVDTEMSCMSHPSSRTIPAAHIKGHGIKAFKKSSPEDGNHYRGYRQKWQCCEYHNTPQHNPHAFVDGGMIFNQTDKSLRVPTCGYYHIFSQIYFQIQAPSLLQSSTVYHILKFDRNCPSWPESRSIGVIGKASIGAFSEHNGNTGSATTYTSDVVRLCAGGRVWVEIPDLGAEGTNCCPMGDGLGTFLGAYLVHNTTCHWPPRMELENLNDPDHQMDE